ncbi:hypothetical protein HZB02_03210 [Candidatus Woesearchaeota archaeon]|nr:hypothetical protein [Candidatus Woesearchaeota archaeon]
MMSVPKGRLPSASTTNGGCRTFGARRTLRRSHPSSDQRLWCWQSRDAQTTVAWRTTRRGTTPAGCRVGCQAAVAPPPAVAYEVGTISRSHQEFIRMNKRAAIELSVNLIITLIIGMVIIGFGLKLTFDIFGASSDKVAITQEQIDRQIEQVRCPSSEKVCIGTNSKKAPKGETVVFTVMVGNPNSAEMDYTIRLSDESCTSMILNNINGHLAAYGSVSRGIAVTATGNRGDICSATVKVQDSYGTQHGAIQKIFVTVG